MPEEVHKSFISSRVWSVTVDPQVIFYFFPEPIAVQV
jgi:hypothetical protein